MKLYGTSSSRALRSIWAAEETGAKYELVPTDFGADSKKAEYLKLNPNGRIPTLVDGELVLFESMAINLYLAKKYGGDLYPSDEADEARALQWSFWGMTEVEPKMMLMVLHKVMLPEDQRRPAVIAAAENDLVRPLDVLESILQSRDYLLGGDFTIADLNVAGAMMLANFVGFDLARWPSITAWMGRCSARPALERARNR